MNFRSILNCLLAIGVLITLSSCGSVPKWNEQQTAAIGKPMPEKLKLISEFEDVQKNGRRSSKTIFPVGITENSRSSGRYYQNFAAISQPSRGKMKGGEESSSYNPLTGTGSLGYLDLTIDNDEIETFARYNAGNTKLEIQYREATELERIASLTRNFSGVIMNEKDTVAVSYEGLTFRKAKVKRFEVNNQKRPFIVFTFRAERFDCWYECIVPSEYTIMSANENRSDRESVKIAVEWKVPEGSERRAFLIIDEGEIPLIVTENWQLKDTDEISFGFLKLDASNLLGN